MQYVDLGSTTIDLEAMGESLPVRFEDRMGDELSILPASVSLRLKHSKTEIFGSPGSPTSQTQLPDGGGHALTVHFEAKQIRDLLFHAAGTKVELILTWKYADGLTEGTSVHIVRIL